MSSASLRGATRTPCVMAPCFTQPACASFCITSLSNIPCLIFSSPFSPFRSLSNPVETPHSFTVNSAHSRDSSMLSAPFCIMPLLSWETSSSSSSASLSSALFSTERSNAVSWNGSSSSSLPESSSSCPSTSMHWTARRLWSCVRALWTEARCEGATSLRWTARRLWSCVLSSVARLRIVCCEGAADECCVTIIVSKLVCRAGDLLCRSLGRPRAEGEVFATSERAGVLLCSFGCRGAGGTVGSCSGTEGVVGATSERADVFLGRFDCGIVGSGSGKSSDGWLTSGWHERAGFGLFRKAWALESGSFSTRIKHSIAFDKDASGARIFARFANANSSSSPSKKSIPLIPFAFPPVGMYLYAIWIPEGFFTFHPHLRRIFNTSGTV